MRGLQEHDQTVHGAIRAIRGRQSHTFISVSTPSSSSTDESSHPNQDDAPEDLSDEGHGNSRPNYIEPDPWGLRADPRPTSRPSRNPEDMTTLFRMNSMTISAPAQVPRPNSHAPPQTTKTAPNRASAPRKSSVPCPLCLDVAMNLTATPCGHVGCQTCLTQSVKIKPECPVCRNPLTIAQLHPLFL